MVWGHPKILKRQQMLFCRIAGVTLPAVARMLLRQIHHEAIAPHLGHYRSRRNRNAARIAPDNRAPCAGQAWRQPVAVNKRKIGPAGQTAHRALHRQQRSLKDIDCVNLGHACHAHRYFRNAFQHRGQFLAPLAAQFLGIIQPLGDIPEIKPNGRRHDRAGQRAAANLVDPDHAMRAIFDSVGFKRMVGKVLSHGVSKTLRQGFCKPKKGRGPYDHPP